MVEEDRGFLMYHSLEEGDLITMAHKDREIAT